jgi:hypothetical protein
MRDYRTYAIRLAVEGGSQVKADLVSVGQSGKQSLKRVESTGERASALRRLSGECPRYMGRVALLPTRHSTPWYVF